MKKSRIKNNVKIIGFLLLIAVFMNMVSINHQVAAAAITMDEEEYNLYVEDFPYFVEDMDVIGAKLNNQKLDATIYSLSLLDDSTSDADMATALEKAGVKLLEEEAYYAMSIRLYKENAEDGEYYEVKDKVNLTVVCSLPVDYKDTPKKIQMYKVGSDGKAKKVPFQLVTVDGIPCFQFIVETVGSYAFVGTENEATSSLPVPTATPKPTKAPEATKAPEPSKEPSVNSNTTSSKPVMNQTASGNQSSVGNQSSSAGNQSSSSQKDHIKDKTPQTGDSSDYEQWILISSCSGVLLLALSVIAKKK